MTPNEREEWLRKRAYMIWQQGGFRPDTALRDWLVAEEELCEAEGNASRYCVHMAPSIGTPGRVARPASGSRKLPTGRGPDSRLTPARHGQTQSR